MTTDVQPPIIARSSSIWVHYPDGRFDGSSCPGGDDILVFLEGVLGYRAGGRGDDRDVRLNPDVEEPRSHRFGWSEVDIWYHPIYPEEDR